MATYDILRGKSAVITGSGRGIGRAIAPSLAHHGVNVAVNYFRHKAQAEETAAAVEAAGARAIVVKAHVGEVEGVQRLSRPPRRRSAGSISSSATPRQAS